MTKYPYVLCPCVRQAQRIPTTTPTRNKGVKEPPTSPPTREMGSRRRDAGASCSNDDRNQRRRVDTDIPRAIMEYAGWTPPSSGAPHAVDREPAAETSPRRLYEEYISKRRPVVLTGGLANTPWSRAGEIWTDAFLLAHPDGETRVRVETRAGTDESFGVGKYETMRFRDFVTRFARGDETVYLTASPACVDAHGRPEVASAPASFLVGENRPARVPFRPELAGNLVPANVNLWLGAAGSVARMPSSGLHHDHHDNLYVLLRGEKRFELYAPDAVEAMYPTGAVRRVHANGRIDYEETGDYAEDGDDGSLRRRVASHAVRLAEAEVERAQTAVDIGTPGAELRLERAETALDAAMDATMGDDDGDGAFEPAGFDDFDDVRDSGGETSDASDASERHRDGDGEVDGRDGDETRETSRDARTADERRTDPPSFSRTSLARFPASETDVDARKRFPLFRAARATRRMETTVRAGEILYLPAGWFHEVRSCNAPGENHAALNYWFHPPAFGAPFETPYGSAQRQDLWERDWAAWEEMRRGS